jgi:hypothetical protein
MFLILIENGSLVTQDYSFFFRDAAQIFGSEEVRHATPVGTPVNQTDDGRVSVADVMVRLVFCAIATLIGGHPIVHDLQGCGRKNWVAVAFDERIFSPPCYGSVLLRGCGA